jgi:hypothetical protein
VIEPTVVKTVSKSIVSFEKCKVAFSPENTGSFLQENKQISNKKAILNI